MPNTNARTARLAFRCTPETLRLAHATAMRLQSSVSAVLSLGLLMVDNAARAPKDLRDLQIHETLTASKRRR